MFCNTYETNNFSKSTEYYRSTTNCSSRRGIWCKQFWFYKIRMSLREQHRVFELYYSVLLSLARSFAGFRHSTIICSLYLHPLLVIIGEHGYQYVGQTKDKDGRVVWSRVNVWFVYNVVVGPCRVHVWRGLPDCRDGEGCLPGQYVL